MKIFFSDSPALRLADSQFHQNLQQRQKREAMPVADLDGPLLPRVIDPVDDVAAVGEVIQVQLRPEPRTEDREPIPGQEIIPQIRRQPAIIDTGAIQKARRFLIKRIAEGVARHGDRLGQAAARDGG